MASRGLVAIAQWIHLRLPSCGPGFESQVHVYAFYIYTLSYGLYIIALRKYENKQKEARFGPFLTHGLPTSTSVVFSVMFLTMCYLPCAVMLLMQFLSMR